MPNPGYKRISFTTDELTWLAKNSAKLGRLQRERPYMIKSGTETAIKQLDKAFSKFWDTQSGTLTGVKDAETVITIDKEGTQFIKNTIEKTKKSLETVVIPGYHKRMNGPSKKKKVQPYIDRAQKKIQILDSILEKLDV